MARPSGFILVAGRRLRALKVFKYEHDTLEVKGGSASLILYPSASQLQWIGTDFALWGALDIRKDLIWFEKLADAEDAFQSYLEI